jgi:3-hydroxyacyl-CoA dehydrogenase
MCQLRNPGLGIKKKIIRHVMAVDLIFVSGNGFPVNRGKPLQYADSVGLCKIYLRIIEFAGRFGGLRKAAPLTGKPEEEGK